MQPPEQQLASLPELLAQLQDQAGIASMAQRFQLQQSGSPPAAAAEAASPAPAVAAAAPAAAAAAVSLTPLRPAPAAVQMPLAAPIRSGVQQPQEQQGAGSERWYQAPAAPAPAAEEWAGMQRQVLALPGVGLRIQARLPAEQEGQEGQVQHATRAQRAQQGQQQQPTRNDSPATSAERFLLSLQQETPPQPAQPPPVPGSTQAASALVALHRPQPAGLFRSLDESLHQRKQQHEHREQPLTEERGSAQHAAQPAWDSGLQACPSACLPACLLPARLPASIAWPAGRQAFKQVLRLLVARIMHENEHIESPPIPSRLPAVQCLPAMCGCQGAA